MKWAIDSNILLAICIRWVGEAAVVQHALITCFRMMIFNCNCMVHFGFCINFCPKFYVKISIIIWGRIFEIDILLSTFQLFERKTRKSMTILNDIMKSIILTTQRYMRIEEKNNEINKNRKLEKFKTIDRKSAALMESSNCSLNTKAI